MQEFNFNDYNKLSKEALEAEIIRKLKILPYNLRQERIERTIKFLEKILTLNEVPHSENIQELLNILKRIKMSMEDYLTAFKIIKMSHLFSKVFSKHQNVFKSIIDGYYAFNLKTYLKTTTNILSLLYEITFNDLPLIIDYSASNTDGGFDKSFEWVNRNNVRPVKISTSN
jgi:hypothetical protein